MSWFDRVRPNRKSPESWALTAPWVGQSLTQSLYGYGSQDGLDSNVVMAPVSWIMRTFTEAEPVVQVKREDIWRIVEDHRMTMVLENPNEFYDGDALWKATVISYCLEGDAYWIKVRSGLGTILELWYVPHWMMKPWWTEGSTTFIDHYRYNPGGQEIQLPVSDVVHFRFGLDPRNTRQGFSPLRPLLREVFTDEEAATFTAAILKNQGVPGLIVSPADGSKLTIEQAKTYKEMLMEHFTSHKRGEPFVSTGATKVEQFGFDPNQLMLGNLRDIAEERVCAMLGVPAAVVGFGSGLQQTKVGAPQPLSARLWTPDGPTTMGDVDVGDIVATPGGWQAVRAVYPQGEQDIYRITFQDGATAESTLDHLWQVHTPNQGWRVEPLSEIASWANWKLQRASLPLSGVTEFDARPCLIPPYVLGLLLADGSFRGNLFFSNADAEIIETVREEVGSDYALNQTGPATNDYRIAYREAWKGRGRGGGTGDLNPFIDDLRRLGLWMLYSHEKFIPDLYKYNSSRVRRELLRGVLDGDGFVNLHGQPAIEQTSTRLADDITEIVQSLGGYTLRSEKKADRGLRFIKGRPMRSKHDRVYLSIVIDDAASLFRCSYKSDRCRPRKKLATRKFRSIEYIRREEAQCIKLDGGLYLTDSFLVTHNTMRENVRLARVNAINPMARTFGKVLDKQLLPDFQSQTRRFRVRFDMSEVSVFQEDEKEREQRIRENVLAGVLRVDKAQELLGIEVDSSQSIYLRESSLVPVPANKNPVAEPAALPAEPGNRIPAEVDGNGAG